MIQIKFIENISRRKYGEQEETTATDWWCKLQVYQVGSTCMHVNNT